ncbi:MAG: VOC family protein [Propionicimonas sp.]|nr:VOC family protein [Propionicimonas sp.]
MDETRLPDDTRMGLVALDVADLDAMTAFYRDVLLLEQLAEGLDSADLGRDGEALVRLRHRPDLPRGERRSAGLYHTALLHPDAATLATVVASLAVRAPGLYTGSADHLVSQAFYLDDPEGNGVELYVDRPREAWQWDGGRVRMGSVRLDPNDFLARHLTDAGRDLIETGAGVRPASQGGQTVGHVHLKVGDTARAKDFYVDTLGFEVTGEFPGALFVSAGGYHHHMAMNTWESEGVGLRAPALGLGTVTISVPGYADLRMVADRAARKNVSVREGDPGEQSPEILELFDPWGNVVRISHVA